MHLAEHQMRSRVSLGKRHGSRFGHDGHHLVKCIGSSPDGFISMRVLLYDKNANFNVHCSMFSGRVISRTHFDDVGTDNVEAIQATDNSPKFSCAPAAGLWRAGCRGKGRIERVDIDRDVNRVITYPLSNFLDDSVDACMLVLVYFPKKKKKKKRYNLLTDNVNLPGFNNFESTVSIIIIV